MLSDLDNNDYDKLNLTIALHPSETIDRMMVRLLAYYVNVQDRLDLPKDDTKPMNPIYGQSR